MNINALYVTKKYTSFFITAAVSQGQLKAFNFR